MTKGLWVIYRKSDSEIAWTYLTNDYKDRIPVPFPVTMEDYMLGIPDKKPDGETPLGGIPEDYASIEVNDQSIIAAFEASTNNQVVNGELVTGEPTPPPIPQPPSSTHRAELISVDIQAEKKATVKRIWEERKYLYDCFITENIKDQWAQGDISIGDMMLVEFMDNDPMSPVVTACYWRR